MAKPNDERVIDYAMPLMQIEKMTKRVHEMCLEKQYTQAADMMPMLIAEARVLQATLAIMETKQK